MRAHLIALQYAAGVLRGRSIDQRAPRDTAAVARELAARRGFEEVLE